MKICIPTIDDHGREALVSPHFGSAPFLTIVDSETAMVEVVANSQSHHAPGACEAARGLQSMSIDVLICPGLGRRAFANLQQAGITVFTTTAGSVDQALAAYESGRLAALRAEEACQGGRHAGGHCAH